LLRNCICLNRIQPCNHIRARRRYTNPMSACACACTCICMYAYTCTHAHMHTQGCIGIIIDAKCHVPFNLLISSCLIQLKIHQTLLKETCIVFNLQASS
jgi:hypothetical protein